MIMNIIAAYWLNDILDDCISRPDSKGKKTISSFYTTDFVNLITEFQPGFNGICRALSTHALQQN